MTGKTKNRLHRNGLNVINKNVTENLFGSNGFILKKLNEIIPCFRDHLLRTVLTLLKGF